jgi:hypothetical protein
VEDQVALAVLPTTGPGLVSAGEVEAPQDRNGRAWAHKA